MAPGYRSFRKKNRPALGTTSQPVRQPRRNRTSAREIRRLQRREQVFGLRVAGRNIRYIAEHVQVGVATVMRDIDATMAAARGRMADRCQSELMLSLERLDQYQASFHEKAKTGDREAAEVCLKIEGQRARLLYPGTGSATAVNVNVGRPNSNLPNAELTGIKVLFTAPDPNRWKDDPVPPSLPGAPGPRPIGAAEMDDARRVTHPRLVEHEPQSEPSQPINGEASGRERVLPGGAIVRDFRRFKRQW